MTALEVPTHAEVARWLTDTVRHAVHIEFYLQRLQVGRTDIQRPHDLVGHGNKLEWEAVRGFAMQYRAQPDTFEKYTKPALTFHRQQHHHRCWNDFNPTSSPDAMRLGAVDAVCSLLEPRGYQGGCHTWDEVKQIAENNPVHKVAWMQLVALEMQKVEKPDLSGIQFHEAYDMPGTWQCPRVPNFDVEMHDRIMDRVNSAMRSLEFVTGYAFNLVA